MFLLLVKYHLLKTVRYFRSKRLAKFITAVAFILIFIGIAFGIYLFLKAGFRFIISDEFLRAALPLFVYEMFLLVMVYLVFASALITALFQLFRTRTDAWIVASSRFWALPHYISLRVLFSSLWPFLVIAIPALAAMQEVFEIGIPGMLLSFVSVVLLTSLIAYVAMVIVLGVSRLFYYLLKSSSFKHTVIFIVILFLLFSFFVYQRFAT